MNILRKILRFYVFVLDTYFMEFIATFVLCFGLLGAYGYIENANHGKHYAVEQMWAGMAYMTGAGILTLAPKLGDHFRYLVDSIWNTKESEKPTTKGADLSVKSTSSGNEPTS